MRWTALVLAPALALGACSGEVPIEPPALLLGEDACAQCRMIISDERFAAGAVVREASGRRKAVGFDDVQCLVEFRRAHGDQVLGAWVKDHDTRAWCEAGKAVYLASTSLHTPMASGLAAFRRREAAERLRKRHPGSLRTWDALIRKVEKTGR